MNLPRLPWYAYAGLAGAGLLLVSKRASAAPPVVISNPIGSAPTHPMHTIKLGSKGDEVSAWQAVVGVPITGTFDAATKAATVAYQKAHGLEADGIVGKNSWTSAGYTWTGASGSAGDSGQQAPTTGPSVPLGASGTGEGADFNPFGLSDNIATREQQILDYAAQGLVENTWEPLTFSGNGHSVTVYVSKRALALEDSRGRYTFNMSYKNAFKLLDSMGAVFLTTKMSDSLAKDSDVLLLGATMATASNNGTIQPWSQDNTMALTYRMNQQADRINQLVSTWNGPVVNEGKDWVQSRRDWPPPLGINYVANRSTNFGWYPGGSKSPGGMSVVQSIGKTHDINHTDYSQLVRGAKRQVILDGQPTDIAVVLADPQLSALLQDEGGIIADTTPPALQGIA